MGLSVLLQIFMFVERVMGIEPTPSAWKAEVLPLNYTRPAGSKREIRPWQGALPDYRTEPNSCRFQGGGGGRIRTFEG